jgi:hypothetical protein
LKQDWSESRKRTRRGPRCSRADSCFVSRRHGHRAVREALPERECVLRSRAAD